MSDEVKRTDAGTFAPGTRAGPGRKPGRPDIYLLAEELAAKEKYDLRGAVWEVLKKMIEKGKGGSETAAKLVLDHLGLPPKLAVEVNLPEDPDMSEDEIMRRIASYVAIAAERAKQAAAKNGTPPPSNGKPGAPHG